MGLVAACLVACSSSDSAAVAMGDGLDFEPAEIKVGPGETITFSNQSSVVHTVTGEESSLPEGADYFASGGFASESEAVEEIDRGFVDPGGEYKLTLDTPGRYSYYCIPHEGVGMKGTIIVEE
jgi:plastocyanin